MPEEPRIEIRAASAAPTVEDSGARPRLAGHFARFGVFNQIDGIEGRFLERIEPGAFARTLKNNANAIRMLFQHGRDPQIGDKPIGEPEVLREDRVGPYFEGDLFESVPPLVVDGLRAGQYGISYRFSVVKEDWDHHPSRSDVNPEGIPERTIHEARVYEFGPVTFPADPGADYAVRALTLSDLDAAFAPPEEPALPAGPEAVPHSDEGTREADVPPVAAPPIRRFRSDDDWLAWLAKEF
jgi:HK97 family phage prohead protease